MTAVVKNGVLRLPKTTSSVARVLQQANQKAKEHRWRKVFIIGEGPHGYTLSNSKMRYYELIGFIEYGKKLIIDEAASDNI